MRICSLSWRISALPGARSTSRNHWTGSSRSWLNSISAREINIEEGDTAEIKHINIVGNTLFSDKEIKDGFESKIPPFWKVWSKDDQYSREKLSGDLEKIRSYYQDRGYIDANVESTQVSISQDKQHIYITANIIEGEQYSIEKIQVTGDLVIEEATLRRLIMTQDNDIFSRKKMEQSVENITALLSNIGNAFANVNPIPQIDRDNRLVTIQANVFMSGRSPLLAIVAPRMKSCAAKCVSSKVVGFRRQLSTVPRSAYSV